MEVKDYSDELNEIKIINYKHLIDERGSFSKIFFQDNEKLLNEINEVYFSDSKQML